jgi:hypothetical protein
LGWQASIEAYWQSQITEPYPIEMTAHQGALPRAWAEAGPDRPETATITVAAKRGAKRIARFIPGSFVSFVLTNTGEYRCFLPVFILALYLSLSGGMP